MPERPGRGGRRMGVGASDGCDGGRRSARVAAPVRRAAPRPSRGDSPGLLSPVLSPRACAAASPAATAWLARAPARHGAGEHPADRGAAAAAGPPRLAGAEPTNPPWLAAPCERCPSAATDELAGELTSARQRQVGDHPVRLRAVGPRRPARRVRRARAAAAAGTARGMAGQPLRRDPTGWQPPTVSTNAASVLSARQPAAARATDGRHRAAGWLVRG